MPVLWLVRHGKTDLIGKKLCGNLPGIHLNKEGCQQAQKTADYMHRYEVKAVYSSPIERALETAQAIASRQSLQVQEAEFLREINFGELQGLDAPDLRQHPAWQDFLEHPSRVRFPQGESLAEAQDRVVTGLDALAVTMGDSDQVVCVAHCEVLRLVVCHAIGLPLEKLHTLTIDPASVSKLEWTARRKKLYLLNWQPE